MEQELNHLNYQRVDNEKDADGIAYVFSAPHKMVRYPFKLPELGPEELRINVTYTGLCHSDAHTVNGEWGNILYPLCPGHEIVGTVAEVGSEVKDFKVGDAVGFGVQRECCKACESCQSGVENLCTGEPLQMYTYGDMYWGGYATILQQPAEFTFKLPEGMNQELAPPLFCAGVTTYAPLARYAKAGDKVAVIGVGGLGHLAVQFAKAMGCEVTAFTSSKEKEAMIKELGASRIVLSTDLEAVNKEAYKFKVIINTLPVNDKELFGAYLRTTKPNGFFIQVGLPGLSTPLVVQPFDIVSKQVHFTGSSIGSREEVKDMLEFCVKHNVYPKCEVFEFDDFPKAFDRLVNGRPVFRCVVNCKGGFKK